jgi:hypothetical protein
MFPLPTPDVENCQVDVDARKRVVRHTIFKSACRALKCFIMLTSPQLALRRLGIIGEYILTDKDMTIDEVFADTIAVFPTTITGDIGQTSGDVHSYRTMVPRKPIESWSPAAPTPADSINHHFNIIPFCSETGQAAGTGL